MTQHALLLLKTSTKFTPEQLAPMNEILAEVADDIQTRKDIVMLHKKREFA